jgi:hypothetical protein
MLGTFGLAGRAGTGYGNKIFSDFDKAELLLKNNLKGWETKFYGG